MGSRLTALEQVALQILHDHGPLSAERLGCLLWPDRVLDPLVVASFLAHLIDHDWAQCALADGAGVFSITAGGDQQLALAELDSPGETSQQPWGERAAPAVASAMLLGPALLGLLK